MTDQSAGNPDEQTDPSARTRAQGGGQPHYAPPTESAFPPPTPQYAPPTAQQQPPAQQPLQAPQPPPPAYAPQQPQYAPQQPPVAPQQPVHAPGYAAPTPHGQQVQYAYQTHSYTHYPQVQKPPTGKSIAGFVLGIVSLFFGIIIPLPIVGLVLGITGYRSEPTAKGFSITAIVLNGLVLFFWVFIILMAMISAAAGY